MILRGLLDYLESAKHGVVNEPPLKVVLQCGSQSSFKNVSGSGSVANNSEALFSSSSVSSLLDEKTNNNNNNKFQSSDALKLSELLSQMSLPGVSRKSQLHLLAVVDTFRQILEAGSGLDECGTRFFISLKIFQFLRKTNFGVAEFSVSNWAWALQSQAHDVLLGHAGGANATLEDVRVLGIPLWLKNPEKLKQLAEGLAKVQFLSRKDPFDCMLLYVALKRLSVLSKMFKVAKKDKLAEFLVNDFTQERWQTAALKNGYAMLKQQQFVQAAAFFLVAGKIRDCLGLLLKHDKDYMLAVIVARLWEGSMGGEQMRWILEEHIAPLAASTGDSWLLSISKWLLGDFVASFHALLRAEVSEKPYEQSHSTNDFQPVVMYYTKHLLAATELVKYKKLDKATFSRLCRKTVYATISSGCIHHCLDFLSLVDSQIVVEEKLAPPVVVAVKKPAFVDAGIFGAFDDGFGDMPTPDWMKPKISETEQQQQQHLLQQQDDNSSVGSSSAIDKASCAESENASLKMKAAHTYLVGSCPRLLQLCHEGKWNEAREFVMQAAKFLEVHLNCEVGFCDKLLSRFRLYCEKYYHFAVQYVLLDPDELREAFFLHHAWDIAVTVSDCLTAARPPSKVQAAHISNVSDELWLCFTQFKGANASLIQKVSIANLLSKFFSAWIDGNFSLLLMILCEEVFVSQRAEGEDERNVASDDNLDVMRKIVVENVVNLVLLDALCARVILLLCPTKGETTEKLMGKFNPSSLEVKSVESLKRYRLDLLDSLQNKFDLVCAKLSGREEEFLSVSKWLNVLRESEKYLQNESFARLCDKVVTLEAIESVLSGAGVLTVLRNKLMQSKQRQQREGRSKPKFEAPVVLIQEADILHTFCIGQGEKVMCAVSTSRGQAELALDEMESVARSVLQQQQKFKHTNETTLMKMSPERLIGKVFCVLLFCFDKI
jgi:hypothetical protein